MSRITDKVLYFVKAFQAIVGSLYASSILFTIAWLGCCSLLSEKAIAQNFPALQFDHLAMKDGLSNNVSRCVSQDKQGFIWIGTANGLNRYDGYRFKQYFHSNADSNSLLNNSIQNLYCDNKGRLWISTDGGISCFLPGRNIFINYSAKLNGPRKLVNNNAVTVFEDSNGIVWLLNQGNSVFRVKDNMDLQEMITGTPAFSFQHSKKEGYAGMYKDDAANEWAFRACRIYLLDKHSKKANKTFDFAGRLNTEILKMAEDGLGNYWVATWGDGLMKFSPADNTLEPIKSVAGFSILDLLPWQYENKHWMLAIDAKDGLYVINPENDRMLNVKANNNDPYTIEDGDLFSLFKGSNGSLWVATDKGVNAFNYKEKVFDVYPVTDTGSNNYDPGQTNMVIACFEDDEGMWLAKRYRSTFLFDSNMHIKRYISNVSRFNSEVLGSAYFSYRLGSPYWFYKNEKELFFSTDSGLVVSDKYLQKPQLYFPANFSAAADLREIVPLTHETLLIRSYRNGLFVFNSSSKKYVYYFSNKDSCAACLPFFSNYLFKTTSGVIYVAGNSGNNLLQYDASKNVFLPIKPSNESQFQFGRTDIYGIDEDGTGRLWMTSANGIYVYNPATNKVENNFTEGGKMGRTRRVCFDKYGNTWVNGYSGIWCYVETTKQWINFTSIDGLPGGNNDGMLARKRNGDILAGLEGSIAVFHPAMLMGEKAEAGVIITEAMIDGKSVPFPLFTKAGKKLPVPVGQGFFSVDFAILNYSNPGSSCYYFKLVPLMKDFQLNDNGHINFNGLSPGHYTLYVKGGDKVGNIFTTEDMLDIYVAPHWYQTGWFIALCLLALAGMVFYFVRQRIKTIKKELLLKQKMTETEMQALRAQMNPHFIFNSLNSIENFIMQNEKRLASDYLNKFSRLIRSILDSSRNELVPLSKDMEALGLYVELEQLRFNNKFRYQAVVDPALVNGDYHVPSLLIQPYIENAIVHGLAHSESEKLNLSVNVTLEHGSIKYIVQDNGIGRQMGWKYKMQNKPYHKSIGLKITEERISLLNKNDTPDAVLITDLYDENKTPCGTKVEITIKAI